MYLGTLREAPHSAIQTPLYCARTNDAHEFPLFFCFLKMCSADDNVLSHSRRVFEYKLQLHRG